MNQTEIMFKTMERKTKLTDGKVCYQGQLVHNRVLDAQSTEAAGNEIAARTSCGRLRGSFLAAFGYQYFWVIRNFDNRRTRIHRKQTPSSFVNADLR